MRISLIILICITALSPMSSVSQCPDRSWLWNRLIYLRDSSTATFAEKLKELLTYEGRIGNCSYKFDSTHTLLLQRIGAAYYRLAEYLKAAQYMHHAIDIINSNAHKPSVDIKQNIRNYCTLAWIYDSLNDVTKKMRAFDSCIAIAARFNQVDLYYATALFRRAEYFFDVGDYHRCVNYATASEKIARANADRSEAEHETATEWALASLFIRANGMLRLREYDAAAAILANKIDECKKFGFIRHLTTIYFQLAELELQKDNYKAALLNYNQAYKYALEADYAIGCKAVLSNIGYDIYFHKLNDANKALWYCRKALSYKATDKSEILNDAFESLIVFGRIGNIYVRRGLYDTAYYYYDLALSQLGRGMNETKLLNGSIEEFSTHKHIHYLTDLLIDKGDALLQQYGDSKKIGFLNKAVEVYKATDHLLDRIKSEQTELESKLFWRQDSRRLYEHAIEACYLQSNYSDAFYFFEKSRAVLLNDQLNEQRWLGEKDILTQTQLKKKTQQLEIEVKSSDKSSPHYSELENELFNNRQELDRVKELIRTNDPLYYQNFVDTNFISIRDLPKTILRHDQTLVELFIGDSAVYILAITPLKSYLQKINKADFDSLSVAYVSYISNPRLLNEKFHDFIAISGQLYQLMFKEIKLPPGRVVVSPEKYFPFEALVTTAQPLTYFVENYAVSYTYSARYLMNDFAPKSDLKFGTFMGIAPVQYANNLAALTGSDRSLKRMGAYFSNATNLVGAEASKNNFLREYYKYRIVQVYAHATDSGYAGEPVIYFSDSMLSLSDLFYENRPATSLIVLSACETAKGRLYNGEGVFSFNRQFAALGIPSSVSNLWMADNYASYQLMESFYKYLAKGLPLDVALQRAKKEFIKNTEFRDHKLPFFWAASILVGQTNSITLRESSWPWLSLIVFLFLIAIWIERNVLNKT